MPFQKGSKGNNKVSTKKTKTETGVFAERMNDMAEILTGLVLGQMQGPKPLNKVNSLEFLKEQVRPDVLTLDRMTLTRMYMQFGLCQAIAEVPVYDAFRNEPIVKICERVKVQKEVLSTTPTDNFKHQGILKKIWPFYGRTNEEEKKEEKIEIDDALEAQSILSRQEWKEIANKIDDSEKEDAEKYLRCLDPAEHSQIMLAAKEQKLYESFIIANIWMRVFGGGGIIINAPDHCGALDKPLDYSKLRKGDRIDWIPADCWELMGADPNVLVGSPDTRVNWFSDTPFMYNGIPLHKSRVLVFKGKEIPSLLRPVGRGWGMSYFEHLCRTLTITWKAQNSRSELLDDAKTDVYGLTGLNSQATNPQLNTALQKRMALLQKGKNYGGGVAIDAADTYHQKQVNFSGFDKMQEQDRFDCAADSRIVMTKLYGMSPSGFSNGDNDRASYEDMVRAEVQNGNIANLITAFRLIGITVTGKDTFVDVDFPPLTQDDPKEVMDMNDRFIKMIVFAESYGLITQGQRAKALNDRQVLPGIKFSSELPLAPEPSLTRFSSNPLMNK